MTENRKFLGISDLDGFDKRKLPSAGFQVELVLADYDGTLPNKPSAETANKTPDESVSTPTATGDAVPTAPKPSKSSGGSDKDDVFSDSEADDSGSSKIKQGRSTTTAGQAATTTPTPGDLKTGTTVGETAAISRGTEQVRSEGPTKNHVGNETQRESAGAGAGAAPGPEGVKMETSGVSEFKAIAADASVFTFGDEDDYDSE